MKARAMLLATFTLVASVSIHASAQGSFEGMVSYRVSGMTTGAPTDIRYFQKTDAFRQEYDMNGTLAAAAIYIGSTGEVIMLMPDTKTYMVMNSSTMTGSTSTKGGKTSTSSSPTIDWSSVKVTATGQRETIAGMACDHYTFTPKGSKDTMDICGASGMGFFVLGGDVSSSGTASLSLMRAQNPALADLVAKGFFALKLTMTSSATKMTFQATTVERKTLDPLLFKPPADYTKMSYPDTQ